MDCVNSLGELGRLALAALLGGVVGHYLTLSREGVSRRRNMADGLARAWAHERKHLSCHIGGPAAFDVDQYARALGPLQRARFRRQLQHYLAAKQRTEQNELGEVRYAAPAEVARCLDALLKRVGAG